VPQAGHRLLPAVVHLPLVVPRLLPAVVRLPLVAARLLPVVVRLPLVAFHLLLVAARLPLVAPHPLLAGLLPSRVFSLPPLVLLNLPPLGQGRPLLSADQVPRVAPPRPFRWEGLHRPVGHRHRHPILFQRTPIPVAPFVSYCYGTSLMVTQKGCYDISRDAQLRCVSILSWWSGMIAHPGTLLP